MIVRYFREGKLMRRRTHDEVAEQEVAEWHKWWLKVIGGMTCG